MEYFRQSLLKYNPDRELSTLLHTHIETDKPKMLFPLSKGKSYVDSLIQQYTVNMYTYPELSQTDNKLAFSLTHPSKSNQNTFQIYEPKRKPIKKVAVKKFTPPPPVQQAVPVVTPTPTPTVPPEPQNFKICPCCNAKVVVKHRCDHSLCQKPCSKMKKPRVQHQLKQQVQQAPSKEQAQEEEFIPNENQGQLQQSRFSHSDHESDYQEDMQISSRIQSSQFLSHEERKKVHDRRKRPRKDMNRSKKTSSQRGRKSGNRISRKHQSKTIQGEPLPIYSIENENMNMEENNPNDENVQQEHQSLKEKTKKKRTEAKQKKKPIRKISKKRKQYSESESDQSEQDFDFSENEDPKQRIQSISKSDSLRKKPTSVVQENNSGPKKISKIFKYCKEEDLKEEICFYIRIDQCPQQNVKESYHEEEINGKKEQQEEEFNDDDKLDVQ